MILDDHQVVAIAKSYNEKLIAELLLHGESLDFLTNLLSLLTRLVAHNIYALSMIFNSNPELLGSSAYSLLEVLFNNARRGLSLYLDEKNNQEQKH